MFLPGEKIEISMRIHMDKRIVSSLNLGPRDMSGTLVLHTVLGNDHFIAISGEYRTRPIDLINVQQGMLTLMIQCLHALEISLKP
jgi:hypothetical protein